MAMNAGMYTSVTGEWATPQDLFDRLNEQYGPFTLDPCSSDFNAKCFDHFTEVEDGLAQPWSGNVFMNPPYGRQIVKWVAKAWESAKGGAQVCCLLPARTDTAWWHDYCAKGHVEFIRGRVKFGGAKGSAPFPSAVVVFRPEHAAERDREKARADEAEALLNKAKAYVPNALWDEIHDWYGRRTGGK
jgi:phage N-6-adenine-methyltransferase